MSEFKSINAGEFLVESGLLFQINRDILHPLGLAMMVAEVNGETTILNRLCDSRDEPEKVGYVSESFVDNTKKLKKFYDEFGNKQLKKRYDKLGFTTQYTIFDYFDVN